MTATDDKAAVEGHMERLRKMADLYCSGCGYCQPCPSGVKIATIFRKFNDARVYGLWENARRAYREIHEHGNGAAACTECEECLEKCPQGISIPERLKEIHLKLFT